MLKRFALLLVFAWLAIGTAKAQTFINLSTVQPTDVFRQGTGTGTEMFYPDGATFDLVSLNLSCAGYEFVRCQITSSAGGILQVFVGDSQTFNLVNDPSFQGVAYLTWSVTARVENPVDLPIGISRISDLQTILDPVANPNNVVSEPSTWILFGTGLAAGLLWSHRNRIDSCVRLLNKANSTV